jgi:predicted MPP superfamily phosphohydrolase
VEPYRLAVERRLVALASLPPALDGLTIALLTDLHLMPNGRGVELAERAVVLANAADPDVVLLGGDLVHWCGAVPHLIPVLRRLRSRYGVFAVLGNHDHHCPWRWRTPEPWGGRPLSPDEWRQVLAQAKVHLLVNEAVPLHINGATVWLAGVDDAYTGRADLLAALASVPDDAFVILLSHSPDIVDDPLIRRVAVVLSGHTHGGQVVLPLLGPLFAPCRDKWRRAQGVVRVGDTWLIVSRGIAAGVPVRFRCPPEVTLLTLRQSRPR